MNKKIKAFIADTHYTDGCREVLLSMMIKKKSFGEYTLLINELIHLTYIYLDIQRIIEYQSYSFDDFIQYIITITNADQFIFSVIVMRDFSILFVNDWNDWAFD